MGRLTSAEDWSTRLTVAGVCLGSPILDGDPPAFAWDDPRFPNGSIQPDGSILLTPEPAEPTE